jgi:hypothetical protein
MKKLVLIFVCAFSTPVGAEQNACPVSLPIAVEAKLLPVLDARDVASRKNDWWDKGYEKAFTALLEAKDEASKEARVALMDYYVGEAYGEELVCAVALDGGKATSLLELYSSCDIKPTHSTVPRNRTLPLRGYALEMLKKGLVKESCTYE